MPRWVGFLGSWALLVLSLGLASFAVAGELINIRDLRRLDRLAVIDQMIAERSGNKAGQLRQNAAQRSVELNALQNKVQTIEWTPQGVIMIDQTKLPGEVKEFAPPVPHQAHCQRVDCKKHHGSPQKLIVG